MEMMSIRMRSINSAAILILAVSCLLVKDAAAASATLNTEFIRTSCTKTTYPRLCFSSLSRHSTLIQTSPKLLASAALNVTLDAARSTSGMMLRLSQSRNQLGMTPREVGAMTDCVEELTDSVDELRRSIAEMNHLRSGSGSSDFPLAMSNIETWVSAALTDENTCFDGFEGKVMNGKVKNAVRGQIVTIAHLTSNALSLVNRFAALQA